MLGESGKTQILFNEKLFFKLPVTTFLSVIPVQNYS